MQTREQYDQAKLFAGLFKGGDHCYGLYDKKYPNDYITAKKSPTLENYLAHIEGRISIGIVPITRTGLSKFGALDIDDHKKGGVKKRKKVIRKDGKRYYRAGKSGLRRLKGRAKPPFRRR